MMNGTFYHIFYFFQVIEMLYKVQFMCRIALCASMCFAGPQSLLEGATNVQKFSIHRDQYPITLADKKGQVYYY